MGECAGLGTHYGVGVGAGGEAVVGVKLLEPPFTTLFPRDFSALSLFALKTSNGRKKKQSDEKLVVQKIAEKEQQD